MVGNRAEILEELGAAVPAARRYARALAAGAGAGVADEIVQEAMQSVGARVRAKELRLADETEARIEAYIALNAVARRKLAGAGRTASRTPAISLGLAALDFNDRSALLLVSLEGFGYDAAARIAGVTREELLSRLMRARGALDLESLRPPEGARWPSHLRIVK